LIQVPTLSFGYLNDSVLFNARLGRFGVLCERCKEANDVARNCIAAANSDRLIKKLLLRFPSEMELSNQIYSPSSGREIESEVVPYETTAILNGKTFPMTIARIIWKVSIVEVEDRVVQSIAGKNKVADKLAQRLASMLLSG
jgi:hypothetical protein